MKDTPSPRAEISVQVHPRSRHEMVRFEGDVWHIWVKAPPVEGAANEAVLAFIARIAGVPGRAVTLVRGASARHKRVAVSGITPDALRERLGSSQSHDPKRRD